MTINTQRVQRVAAITIVSYFIAYTVLCWFLDFAFPGKLATQMRVRFFFDAGVISGVAALLCSFALWRSHRPLAVAGFVACLAWVVWTALPRI
jgi:hypothetical protein